MNEKALLCIMDGMEKKLIELMGIENYSAFSCKLAKEAFKASIEGLADGEFKSFVINNFDAITGGGIR